MRMGQTASTELIDRLRQALQSGLKLRLALLFGSFARGTARPDSDVDIAILPMDADLSLSEELALQASLSSIARREVDLVRLDRCYPLLRWRVAKEGIVVLANAPADETRFRARAGIEHAEFEPMVRKAGESFRRRLARDGEPPIVGSDPDR